MKPFDVCVIGAGPAGYAAAMRAHDLGKRVAIVEKAEIGGVGIQHGALSSKTLWHMSNDFVTATASVKRYCEGQLDVNCRDVIREVAAAVEEKRSVLAMQLEVLRSGWGSRTETDSERPRMRGEGQPALQGIRFFRGAASFTSPHSVEVHLGSFGFTIEAENFVLATGSKPRLPPGLEADGKHIVTSDHIELMEEFPKSLVIVGAGVIGCEYATIFSNFGKTKIFLIDRQPRILPFEDEDVAAVIARNLQDRGVIIHKGAKLESLKVREDGVKYVITGSDGTHENVVERALVAVGRVPNLARLCLDKAGLELKDNCLEVVDTQTKVPHIYAAGDSTLDVALANVAELEGRFAIEKMFGLNPPPLRYESLSAIMFLRPEVASVGLNETQARQKGIRYRAAVVQNRLINRYIAMRETHGFIKLLACPEPPYRILGLRVVGREASSTIQGIALLIELGATLEDLERCIHPHPAITEGVQECARILLGRSILKPEVLGREGLVGVIEG